ncbi:hypothetical protein JCM1840_002326 [Sporobolomyces johnsonii]
MSSFMEKVTEQFEKIPSKLDKLKEDFKHALDRDSRHDTPEGKAADEQRAAIAASHRFNSFASPKEGNNVKWFIGGNDYYFALSELLENAKETIWVFDWWLTPELYLRRPPTENEDYRVDRILKKKAEQGVKIYICVYEELPGIMTMDSSHTQKYLEGLHPNIAVMRHPDHIGGQATLYWSHHEKLVIVDNTVACIGGLDACFGRYDTNTYPLADVHPTDFARTIQPGQDYNNARIQDFQHVAKWASNQQSRLETARLPWHDCHAMFVGPAVMDVGQHFVERWNFVKTLKYKDEARYSHLAFQHVVSPGDQPQQEIVRHPYWQRFLDFGKQFSIHRKAKDEGGNIKVQVLRSSADWSSGIQTEHSIQNAYVQLIDEAEKFILIHNQFFISSTGVHKSPVKNLVAKALVERILKAARASQAFKCIVLVPALPGLANSGTLQSSHELLAVTGAILETICRGGDSICELIAQAGFKPDDYIHFVNLRGYDRINNDPQRLQEMANKSGITFEQAQAALSRIYLGRHPNKEELEKNKTVTFSVPAKGGEQIAFDDHAKVQNKEPDIKIPLPASYDDAWEQVNRFEHGDVVREKIADSVSHHAMAGTGSLLDEPWSGNEESEKNAFVTEEIYPHIKVRHRKVLIGSANINDRSQNGDRDSEIAIVIEDNEEFDSRMDGQPYKATRFAATLRRQLYKEHLGLTPPQALASAGNVPAAMRMVGVPEDDPQSAEDDLVMDPLSPATEGLWKSTAAKNAAIFEDVFHCVPSNKVETWEQYNAFVPPHPVKAGHVWPGHSVQYIKEQLDQVRGHLVAMPLNFLCKERLIRLDSPEVNPITLRRVFSSSRLREYRTDLSS